MFPCVREEVGGCGGAARGCDDAVISCAGSGQGYERTWKYYESYVQSCKVAALQHSVGTVDGVLRGCEIPVKGCEGVKGCRRAVNGCEGTVVKGCESGGVWWCGEAVKGCEGAVRRCEVGVRDRCEGGVWWCGSDVRWTEAEGRSGPLRQLLPRQTKRMKGPVRRRLCCRSAPYTLRAGIAWGTAQHLRRAVERENAVMAAAVGGCSRPPLACLPYTHHAHLLTLADLLDGCSHPDPFTYQDTKVKNVSKCRGCDTFTLCGLLFGYEEQENTIDIEKLTPTALHVACLLPQPGPLVARLVGVGSSGGGPLSEPNILGQTPLHALLLGDVRSSSVLEALQVLLTHGADVSVKDNSGETPLHLVRNLLRQGLHQRAAQVAQALLQAGAQVDAANNEGRTLLTYSVEHLDDSLALTRTLLNHGASVWGAADGSDKDQSVFTWFLKAVITQRGLHNSEGTVGLLSLLMAESPRRMYQHVLRTMFRQSRCYKVLGPVFLELKTQMMPHWSQPPSLATLCVRSVRAALPPPRLLPLAPLLPLPSPLLSCILLGEPVTGGPS